MVGNVFWNSIWIICFISKSAFQTKYLVTLDPSFDFQTLVIILGIMNGTTYLGVLSLEQDWQIGGVKKILELMAVTSNSNAIMSAGWHYWLVGRLCRNALSFCYLCTIAAWDLFRPKFCNCTNVSTNSYACYVNRTFFFILNMIALGGGPTFAGWLMDVFGNNYNEIESIRYSLTVTTCVFIPSVISFLLVSKFLLKIGKRPKKEI